MSEVKRGKCPVICYFLPSIISPYSYYAPTNQLLNYPAKLIHRFLTVPRKLIVSAQISGERIISSLSKSLNSSVSVLWFPPERPQADVIDLRSWTVR
jgi:hypothetical protein